MKTKIFHAVITLFIFSGTELSYAQKMDSISYSDGQKVAMVSLNPVKIVTVGSGNLKDCMLREITTEKIVYEKDKCLHDLLIEKIDRIELNKTDAIFFEEGHRAVIRSLFTSEVAFPDNNVKKESADQDTTQSKEISANYYVHQELERQGKIDARKYYKARGAYFTGFLCGLTVFYGLPIAVISAACPPTEKNLQKVDNPNNDQLKKNPSYHDGFKKAAHGKKVANTTAGYITGIAGLLLLVAAVVL